MHGLRRCLFRPLVAVFTMLVGSTLASTEVRAGLVGYLTQPPDGGIIVVAGDPVYRLTFLGYERTGVQFLTGDYVKLFDVPGTAAFNPGPPPTGSTTSQPQNEPLVPTGMGWTPILSNPSTATWQSDPPISVPSSDFTFYYSNLFGPATALVNNSGSDRFLGQFSILTYIDLPALVANAVITINYLIHAHDLSGNVIEEQGTLVLTQAVPEPCSLVMLGLGAVGAVGWSVRRRRAAAASASASV
ncbi:PEP-CTERM sorting domain-containing protein [Paludisphaera rhizosphaerae]|uniref:PEP-CTERM sorting domain-containing protein n=1 Tax=Paludisphaera rhizosphaerae TaxID=2711216 RepID=UPI0013EACED6|nr:PEP-CTERM sorting domain-containing protein [Paludisphaera rhizosphaerae]